MNADMEDLKRKYEELTRKLIAKEEKSPGGELMDNTDLPFTDRVLSFPLPDNFKMPRVKEFDESFPFTLEGVAQDWFARLPAKSVDNFKTLGRLFLSQFLATRKRKKHSACLLSLRQGNEESLKDFMLRFNKEKLLVENPGDQMVLSALWHGVRPNGPLMTEVSKRSTKITLREFIKKTEEYINQEEMIKALTKGQEEEDGEKEDAKNELLATSTPKEGKFLKKVAKKTVPTFPKIEAQRRKDRRFTPLNTGVNEVFMEIRRDPAFRWPNKLKGDSRKRDRTKFCEYHNDHGHLTEDCITLR
ncbi:uncharacterized protein LOC132181868 [Corylus avellana]|uniref:uncharacterized protein LOC132181868 n=1 Tax=Corylus avellana TaxID=13451 RepID=UPI00286CE09B|nr:uncharacterized protein LOC132181868 [Corylus avellana]